jgi:hypothetical protein
MSLPEDILQGIFNFVDPYEAEPLTRVCRTWHYTAQEHLYSSLELDTDKSFRCLHRTLCARPSLAAKTKSLIFPLVRVNMSKLRPADIHKAYASRGRIDDDGYFIASRFNELTLNNLHFHGMMQTFYEILIHCRNLKELHAPLAMIWIHTELPPFESLRHLVLICPHFSFKRSPIFSSSEKFTNLESVYLMHGNSRVANQMMKMQLPALKNLYLDGFFGIDSVEALLTKLSSPNLLFYCNAILADEMDRPHRNGTINVHPASELSLLHCGSLAYNLGLPRSPLFTKSTVTHLILISSESRRNNVRPVQGLRSFENLNLDIVPESISKLTLVIHDRTGEELAENYLQGLRALLPTLIADRPKIKVLHISIKGACSKYTERREAIALFQAKSIELRISFTYRKWIYLLFFVVPYLIQLPAFKASPHVLQVTPRQLLQGNFGLPV